MLILSTAYLAPIAHYKLIQEQPNYYIDGKEHYLKQSQRNRATIFAANGPLSLSVPVKKYGNHELTENIEISYAEDWQTIHWRSFESAYRNTAYFEFYADEFRPFFEGRQFLKLMEFNLSLEKLILELLEIDAMANFTQSYTMQDPDWRLLLSPKNSVLPSSSFFPAYPQAFSDKHGFQPNLSILDLLFNLGPHAQRYLEEVRLLN